MAPSRLAALSGALATTVAIVTAAPPSPDALASGFLYSYDQWRTDFPYARYLGSRQQFDRNLAFIRAHNAGNSSWKAGVNKFTSLHPDEFRELIIGGGHDKPAKPLLGMAAHPDLSTHVPVAALPASLDWRQKGVTTPVKDQYMCGSCWAFSASQTLESHIAITTGRLYNFSEQQLVSCTANPHECGGTGGCDGATQELAFDHVKENGITVDESWPYLSHDGVCDWSGRKAVAGIKNYVTLPFNNYTALMNAVVSVGPIAVSAAASQWMFYSSGVFDGCTGYQGADINHAVVLEGYGTDKTGRDYWLVRNSWSDSWGEGGYIRIARYGSTAKGEPCAIDQTPEHGSACKGQGPATVTVCGMCGILADSSYPTGGFLVR